MMEPTQWGKAETKQNMAKQTFFSANTSRHKPAQGDISQHKLTQTDTIKLTQTDTKANTNQNKSKHDSNVSIVKH